MRLASTGRAFAAALAFALAASAVARAQIDFAAPRACLMGAGPRSLAAADFDEDGRLDLVAADSTGIVLRLFRDEELLISSRADVPVAECLSMAVGDVDGDGHADVALSAVGSVAILFGDGAGGFSAPAVVYGAAGRHPDLALPDLNGDGLLDVAFPAESSKLLGVVLQTAPRTFLPATTFAVESGDGRIGAGDFDGDGFADVAVAMSNASALRLFRGDGLGGFSSSALFPLANQPSDLAVADLDGDGRDDLALTFLIDGVVRVFRGDAPSGLVPGSVTVTGQTFTRAEAVDADGDGTADLVLAYLGLDLLPGDGAGGFGARRTIASGLSLSGLAVADLSGDGRADVAAASEFYGVASLFLGAGGGAFLGAPELATPVPYGVVSGDFNEDGNADLAMAGWITSSEYRVFLFYGDGAGGILASGVADLRRSPSSLFAGDFAGDGHLDLFVGSLSNDSVTYLDGDGVGFTDRGDLAGLLDPAGFAMADADGDGAPDLAVANRLYQTVGVYFGNGAGGIASTASLPAGGLSQSIGAADFDGDGFGDFAVAAQPGGIVRVFFGGAARAFTPVTIETGVGAAVSSLAAADVDADGFPDIVLADAAEAAIRVLLGDGARGFSWAAPSPVPQGAAHVAVADVTGDGRRDALLTHGNSGLFSVAAGDGRGGFGVPRSYQAGPFGTSSAVADLDEDGRLEIAVTSLGYGRTSLLFFRETAVTACLEGTVNARAGGGANVLFVNSRIGDSARRLALARTDPASILVARPPLATGLAPFALYLWRGAPTSASLRALPQGLGSIAFPFALRPGSPQPYVVWNNIGSIGKLGAATLPSSPAPTVVLSRPEGLGVRGTFTLQGVILDPAGPNGRAAVTNGIVIDVR